MIDSRNLSRAFFFTSLDHTAIFYRCNRQWSKWLWPMQGVQKIKLIAESTYQIITYYHFNGLDNNCFSLRILAERTKYWSEVSSIVRVPFSFQKCPVNFNSTIAEYRWQWCWWHRYVGHFMMVTDLRCWWQNHYVGDFVRYVGDFPNVLNRSSTSQTCHQHIWSPTSVTNINLTFLHRCWYYLLLGWFKKLELRRLKFFSMWCDNFATT